MNSKIYKITNDINDKIYVGKTTSSIEERFKQHLIDARKSRQEKRPLYNAINLYGAEHFSIELIEECDISLENEREQYWIGYYRGYEDGYIATKGGDGKILYDYQLIENYIKQGKTTKEIIALVGCCADVVHKVAKQSNSSLNTNNILEKNKIAVAQYDLNGNYIQSFDSYADAARWLYSQGKISKISSGVRSHIGEVCNGTRKSAYKYIWRRKVK